MRLSLIVVLIFVTAGCSERACRVVPHARWDPGACQDYIVHGHGAWTEQTVNGLLHRMRYQAFWSLVERLLHHAPRADYVVIAEYVPANPVSEELYWFGFLVQAGADYWCYSGGQLPACLGGEGSDFSSGAWGPVVAKREAKAYIEMLERANLLSEDISDVDIWDGGLAIEARPWLIHVYRRAGNHVVRLLADHPMLNSDVVFGRKRLDHLFRLFDAGRIDESELASIGLQRTDLQGKRGKEVEAEYRESFPTRLILNGLLRVLWSERSALDERSPPE